MNTIIQTKNLSKSYGKTQVLKNIDLAVEEGEFTAIMGPSGSGKTTLMNTLSTIDTFNGGNIWIEGTSLLEVKKKSLREFRQKRMGFIFQDYNLLDTLTVKENILLPLSLQKTHVEEMEKRLSNIIQPLNIESILNHYPSEISGGQKQRIAIARAILADPRILILDDATASVDMATESEIQRALGRLMEGRTTFVIAHRISSIKDADLIVVLEHGQIVERGTHAMLLESGGSYRRIYDVQFKDEADTLSQLGDRKPGKMRTAQ